MKLKLKIQQKIQLFIISASIIIYVTAVGYISFKAKKMAYNDAIEITNKQVQESAKDVKAKLDTEFSAVIAISNSFKIYKDFEKDEWQQLIHKMYDKIFENNPNIYALWDSWELSMIDPNWDKPYGRISHSFWRDGGIIKDNVELRSLDGDSELYAETKSTLVPSINEPYFDVLTGDKTVSLLMTSLSSPIVENGKFIAVIAYDITLLQLQEVVEKIKPFDGSYAFITSNGGLITGHPDKEMLNRNIEEIFPEDSKNHKISQNIREGKSFSYVSTDKDGTEIYVTYAPIYVMNTNTPWSIAISVPVNIIMQEANRNFKISIIVGIIGILLMALVIAIIGRNITNPLIKITLLLKQLAKGHIDDKMRIKIETGDEIEEMSEALNSSIEGLNKKVDFANNIGQGELSQDFDLLSDDDILGKSLIEMRKSLVKADEDDEKRTVEDEKRRWTNEGLAKFADILRQNNDNLENLATEIMINLIAYLEANQGGVFILNDDDKENVILSLLSAYAYDRRKFMKKHIELGEGLVGNCAIEKKTIFMTAIPQDYLEITSGLGGANPNSLLIVPLKVEQNVLGVLEIASFKVFKDFEIEFVEKLAESIASTLSSVKINIRTSELLERSQQQAEEMAAQEEEMRQNMEELQATQEESTRKGFEMEGFVEALNTSSYVIEYDLDGYIQKINDNYILLIGLSKDELIGTHHSENIVFTEKQKSDYEKFWANLRSGKVINETTTFTIKGEEYLFSETYTPMKSIDGEVHKVLKISNNITDFQNHK
ncbi:MAG: cache domain-containing protein [Bacteroidales bacterium]|jgi:methyl-accepting chemotaxis protein|nr:cache domain-containing protein [Bacteroidales bacterium]